MVLMFSSYCSWDICRGALTPVITYWLKLASIVVFWISLVSFSAIVDPWLASIFAWNKTWAILLALLISSHCPFYAVILRSLRLVYLVVTLSVTMLDGWCFNAKYANYLRDHYDQFLWSLSFLLKWLVWSHFNVIIVWFVMTCLFGFSGRTFAIFDVFLPGILPSYSYLPPTVTTSRCGCWLLSEFPICNAKCLCYVQFLVTGFNGRMPYPLTWAC